MNSRTKGKEGEREAARFLSALFGLPVRRGQQFRGGPDSPDVVGLDGLHLEVKRRERLNLDAALRQSFREAGPDQTPVVMHRSNRSPWKFTIYAEDLPRFTEAISRLFLRGRKSSINDNKRTKDKDHAIDSI